jgi:hypothetical protein
MERVCDLPAEAVEMWKGLVLGLPPRLPQQVMVPLVAAMLLRQIPAFYRGPIELGLERAVWFCQLHWTAGLSEFPEFQGV